jgi:hypothetical protein
MKQLVEKAELFAEKFEGKTTKMIAFGVAFTGLLAFIPTVIAGIVWIYFFFVDLINISTYVKEFKATTEYHDFQIMQLTHMVEAEADPKEAFGIPVRMTNTPDGHTTGDLWYFTYIKVNGKWRPIIYGAFPNKTKKQVGILNMKGKYNIAGEEARPLDN